jgi:hypothetical protein
MWYGANAKVQQLRLPSFHLRWETAREAGILLYGVPKAAWAASSSAEPLSVQAADGAGFGPPRRRGGAPGRPVAQVCCSVSVSVLGAHDTPPRRNPTDGQGVEKRNVMSFSDTYVIWPSAPW